MTPRPTTRSLLAVEVRREQDVVLARQRARQVAQLLGFEATEATRIATSLATGAPVLQGAVVSFDCRIADIIDKGTHSVIFAEVAGIRGGSHHEHGLIYFGRDYHPVGKASA